MVKDTVNFFEIQNLSLLFQYITIINHYKLVNKNCCWNKFTQNYILTKLNIGKQ